MTLIIQIPINVDAPDDPPLQEWVEREWIGVGKKYPISGEVPTFVQEARSKTLTMPPECLPYIPSQKMSIMQQQYPHSARMAEHSPSTTHTALNLQ
jgi:hypothetical protein